MKPLNCLSVFSLSRFLLKLAVLWELSGTVKITGLVYSRKEQGPEACRWQLQNRHHRLLPFLLTSAKYVQWLQFIIFCPPGHECIVSGIEAINRFSFGLECISAQTRPFACRIPMPPLCQPTAQHDTPCFFWFDARYMSFAGCERTDLVFQFISPSLTNHHYDARGLLADFPILMKELRDFFVRKREVAFATQKGSLDWSARWVFNPFGKDSIRAPIGAELPISCSQW